VRLETKLKLLMKRPNELLARAGIKLESGLAVRDASMVGGRIEESGRLDDVVEQCHGSAGGEALNEPALRLLEAEILNRLSLPANRSGYSELHNGSLTLGRLCYAAVRALKPDIVIETGVARGVTSACVLGALRENGKGRLHSIDLPPLAEEAERLTGCAIPELLKDRWSLHRGTTRALLEDLLRQCGGRMRVFIHDSLHTHRNMYWEMMAAYKTLARPGMIIADDVELNRAFEEFVEETKPSRSGILQESGKEACCGYTLFEAR